MLFIQTKKIQHTYKTVLLTFTLPFYLRVYKRSYTAKWPTSEWINNNATTTITNNNNNNNNNMTFKI